MNTLQDSYVVGLETPTTSRAKLDAQYKYMFKMAPYLRLAKTAGNEDEFYDMFFKSWFKRWPETPTDYSDSIEKGIKKMVKSDYTYILIGIQVDAEKARCDWRTGFHDEDAIDDEAPASGPGSDFIAFTAGSGI